MEYYIYIDGMADPNYLDPPNYNFHVGTYLASDGSECIDGGDGEGPGNRKFYHNIVYKSGAWIHASLNNHPERIRGDTQSMALPIENYFNDLNNIYFEIRQDQSTLTTVWFDEWSVFQTNQNENNITIDGLWVGYWGSADRWEIGWQDPYTIEKYGNGSNSTFEIRYSTLPITNENWGSANVVKPEVNRYGASNFIRRPNSWKRTVLTYFYLPDSVEAGNSKIYFAVKDVSSTTNGDAHNGNDYEVQSGIATIDYDLSSQNNLLPAKNLKIE